MISSNSGIAILTSKITVFAGKYVDSINGIGGGGGNQFLFTLDEGEKIEKIFWNQGSVVDSIGFKTTKGTTFGPFGGTGGHYKEVSAPNGFYIHSIQVTKGVHAK
jgi:hypothetical protein